MTNAFMSVKLFTRMGGLYGTASGNLSTHPRQLGYEYINVDGRGTRMTYDTAPNDWAAMTDDLDI
jgi:hypothetical protein